MYSFPLFCTYRVMNCELGVGIGIWEQVNYSSLPSVRTCTLSITRITDQEHGHIDSGLVALYPLSALTKIAGQPRAS